MSNVIDALIELVNERRWEEACELASRSFPHEPTQKLGMILAGAGWYARDEKNYETAESLLNLAIEVLAANSSSVHFQAGAVSTLSDLAANNFVRNQGKFLKMKQSAEAALHFESVMCDAATATMLKNKAMVLRTSGELDASLKSLEQAIELVQDPDSPARLLVKLELHRGIVLANLGRLEEAAAAYSNALSANERTSEHDHYMTWKLTLLSNLAVVRDRQGKIDEAIELAKKSSSAEFPGDPQGLRRAMEHINLGSYYRKAGNLVKARQVLNDAVRVLRDVTPPARHLKHAELQLFHCDLIQGKLEQAKGRLERLLEMVQNDGENPRLAAYILQSAGNLLLAEGLHVMAEEKFKSACDMLTQSNSSPQDRAELHYSLAIAQSNLRKFSDCESTLSRSLELCIHAEQYYADDSSHIQHWRATYSQVVAAYISILLIREKEKEALLTLDRFRCRELKRSLLTANVDIEAAMSELDLARYKELKAQLSAFNRSLKADSDALDSKHDLDNDPQIRDANFGSEADLDACLREIDKIEYYHLPRHISEDLRISEIQNKLEPSQTVLNYCILGPEFGIAVFLITSQAVNVYRANHDEATFRQRLQSFQQICDGAAFHHVGNAREETWLLAEERRCCEEAYELLMRPLEPFLAPSQNGIRELLIVPGGHFVNVAWAALLDSSGSDEGKFLCETARIHILPFISMLNGLEDGRVLQVEDGEADKFLCIANPLSTRLLKYAETEAVSICRLFDPSGQLKPLLREDALRIHFETQRNSKYIHLATHGNFNERDHRSSRLIFTPVNAHRQAELRRSASYSVIRSIDILKLQYDPESDLTLRDLMMLHREGRLSLEGCRLLTLSACQVGRTLQNGGDDFMGFLAGIFNAGCQNTVAALSNVHDYATSLLMTRFYEELLNKVPDPSNGLETRQADISIAEALRRAQTWMLGTNHDGLPDAPASHSHPYFWAGFQLYGAG